MAVRYVRDVPIDAERWVQNATIQHVRDHCAAVADADDDPETRSEDVEIRLEQDDAKGVIHVIGHLNAEPTARYLEEGFEPFEGIEPELVEMGMPDGEN